MAKHGEDDVNVLHPSLRSIYLKPEKSLGLDKDKITIDLLRDVFRKNCIALMDEFANAGKPKLDERQLILAYHMARGTIKGTANQVKTLIETSPYFDFHPQYMLPLLRPVKSLMPYNKEFRAFRMLAVVYTPEQNFQLSNILDWSTTYTFSVEYVMRRHTIQKKYEDFVKLNQELEQELLTLPTFPPSTTGLGQAGSKGVELQEYIRRLHHALADRGVFSPRLMKFLAIDYEQVQTEEEGAFVLTLDSSSLPPNTAWHFIDEVWLDKWRTYVRGRAPRRYFPPGKITNARIYTQWRLFDDALKAAQRVREDDDDALLLQQQLQQQQEHKQSFAHMVLKLTRSEQLRHQTGHQQHNNKDEKQGRMRRLRDLFERKRSDEGGEEGEEEDEEEEDEDEEKRSDNEEKTDDENDDENDDEYEEDNADEKDNDKDADKQRARPALSALKGLHKSHAFRKAKRRELAQARRLKRQQRKQQAQTHEDIPKLIAIRDYRCVNFNVFRFLQIVHGGGPVISRALPDLYSPVAYSFLHAVVLVQTRIRIKLARLRLKELRMQQLSQSYAGKWLLVHEAQRCITRNAQKQLEVHRQQRIARNLETAATFTQNLWRLKKKYYLEDALQNLRKEQEAFRVVQRIAQLDTADLGASGSGAGADLGRVVTDLKPIVQVGNTNTYTRVLVDSVQGGLPFTLQRVPGTEQAVILLRNNQLTDDSTFVHRSILRAINRVPTSTLSYADILARLSNATFPLTLELERPFDPVYLPSLYAVVTLKVQGSLRVAIYAAFKLAFVRGIPFIKHASNSNTKHATTLCINDHALLYSNGISNLGSSTLSNGENVTWTRLSLFDIKFVRDARDSDAIQRLQTLQRVDGRRCVEIVLNERSLLLEFPRLDRELRRLSKQRQILEAQMQQIATALHDLEDDEDEDEDAGEMHSSRRKNQAKQPTQAQSRKNKVHFQLSFSTDKSLNDSSDHSHRHALQTKNNDRPELIAQLFEQKRTVDAAQNQVLQELEAVRRMLVYHRLLVRGVRRRRNASFSASFSTEDQDAKDARTEHEGDDDAEDEVEAELEDEAEVESDVVRAFRPDLVSLGASLSAANDNGGLAGQAAQDDVDDNADMDAQDVALCQDFDHHLSNESWLLKRVFVSNLKRLIAEIRGTQVFVNKTGLPVRRKKQKATLQRIEG